MTENPLVDIIIPTRNNAFFLKENLHAISQQTFTNYRCYVVDDASTDTTIDMLAHEFPWVKILGAQKQSGPSRNRNLALSQGASAFVAFLDDDVVLAPDWLKAMLDFIFLSSAIAAVGSQIRFHGEPDILNGIGGFFRNDGVGEDLFFKVRATDDISSIIQQPRRIVYACSAAMLARRSVLEKIDGFDPLYFYLAEDFDLGLRMNAHGHLVVYNPKAIAYHRYHKTAATFPKKKIDYLYYRNSLYTILKNFSFPTSAIFLARLIRRKGILFSAKVRSSIWSLLHCATIIKWRYVLSRCRVTSEAQILSLNTALASLRSGSVTNNIPHKQSWQKHLLSIPLQAYLSFKRTLQRMQEPRHCVDNIIFLVTNLCDCRCKHCFLHASLNTDIEKNLSLSEIKQFFTSLGRVKNIVLGGGEPFLRQDLDEICINLDAISHPELITIPTNGFESEVIAAQVKRILEKTRMNLKISLSLDGPAELHDEIRRSPGLFERVHKTYAELTFLHAIFFPRLQLQINATLWAENYPQFLELYHLVRDQFANAEFTFEIIRGSYDSTAVSPISEEMHRGLLRSLEEINDPALVKILKLHKLALRTIAEKKQVVACTAGENFIALDFRGNLSACEMLPYCVNIRDIGYDFSRAVRNPDWRKTKLAIKNNSCYCTHLCFLASSFDSAKVATL